LLACPEREYYKSSCRKGKRRVYARQGTKTKRKDKGRGGGAGEGATKRMKVDC